MKLVKFDGTNPLSFAPGTLIGRRKDGRPIYQQAGGAPKEDEFDSNMGDDDGKEETEEEDDEDTEEDADEEEGEKEDKKPEVKKTTTAEQEEINRLKQRLAKTRRESAARRKKLEELSKTSETKKDKDGEESEAAVTEARTAGYSEAETKYKTVLHAVAGRAALMEAGVKPAKAKRALKLIDFDEVEIDDDGEISGIEDAIEDLKEEWPELFVAEREEEETPAAKTRVKSNHVNGAGRTAGKDKKPKTSTELALERLVGTRR